MNAHAGGVASSFDIMAVRMEDEGAVIIRMLLRPQARRAVVTAARAERGLVECIHPCSLNQGDWDNSRKLRHP